MNREELRQLLANQPDLESFTYIEHVAKDSKFHFDVIAEQQPKLKHLTYMIQIIRSTDGFEHLKSLKYLKSLSVSITPTQEPYFIDYLNTVAANGMLESLILHVQFSSNLDDERSQRFVSALSSVHSLRQITLAYVVHTMAELTKFAKSMPLLEKITIKCINLTIFGINRNTLLELLAVATNLRELCLHLPFRYQDYFSVGRMHPLKQCENAVRQRSNPKARNLILNFCTFTTTSEFIGELIQITNRRCTCGQINLSTEWF